ncbi:MAG: hypothetical protein F6K42_37015, partial [Leptolyngbya sp. SIO1D8]|nr:hypothetical protein [Leptolyngbya sp. SIO1D8]
ALREITLNLSESEAFGSVQWVQDDSLYALSYRKDIFTSEGAIAMATSMVGESPLTTPQSETVTPALPSNSP